MEQTHGVPSMKDLSQAGGDQGDVSILVGHVDAMSIKDDRGQQGDPQTTTKEGGRGRQRRPKNWKRIPRTTSLRGDLTDDEGSARSTSRGRRKRTASVTSVSSVKSRVGKVMSIAGFRKFLRSQGANVKTLDLVKKYSDNRLSLAEYSNSIKYLTRCRQLGVIPSEYWQDTDQMKKTKNIQALLDEFSFRLMMADLDYNKRRRDQVSKHLQQLKPKLRDEISEEQMHRLNDVVSDEYNRLYISIKEEQRAKVVELLKAYDMAETQSRPSSRAGSEKRRGRRPRGVENRETSQERGRQSRQGSYQAAPRKNGFQGTPRRNGYQGENRRNGYQGESRKNEYQGEQRQSGYQGETRRTNNDRRGSVRGARDRSHSTGTAHDMYNTSQYSAPSHQHDHSYQGYNSYGYRNRGYQGQGSRYPSGPRRYPSYNYDQGRGNGYYGGQRRGDYYYPQERL